MIGLGLMDWVEIVSIAVAASLVLATTLTLWWNRKGPD